MQFFKHQTNMSDDTKIKRLIRKHGIKGYAVYVHVLERIAKELSSSSPLPDLEETAEDIVDTFINYERQETITTDEIKSIFQYCVDKKLFTIDSGTQRILCHKIYAYLEKSQTKSKEIRSMIEKYKQINNECDEGLETGQDRSDRSRSRSRSRKRVAFAPPSVDEIRSYLQEKNITAFTPESFWNFYDSKGWMVGSNKMTSWHSAVATWVQRHKEAEQAKPKPKTMKEMYG